MHTVPTQQLVDVIDTVRAVRTYSSGAVRILTACRAERWGLQLEFRTPEDPEIESETCWLLPADGLRMSAQRPRISADRARGRITQLTAVRIEHDARHWRTTDMLLGLSMVSGSVPRFVCYEDFAAAVTGGVLRRGDADRALYSVYRALDQLARLHYDVGSWLSGRGITQPWPPLLS